MGQEPQGKDTLHTSSDTTIFIYAYPNTISIDIPKEKVVDFVGQCKLLISGSGVIDRCEFEKMLVLCQNFKKEASEHKGVPGDLMASLDRLVEENKELRKENDDLKAQVANLNVTINNMREELATNTAAMNKMTEAFALNNALMRRMLRGAPQPPSQPTTSDLFSEIQDTLTGAWTEVN